MAMFGPVEGLSPEPPDPGRPERLHAQVTAAIRQSIEDGAWAPGSRLLPEPELAETLGISRGTLRRALAPLTAAGLLTQIQGRGTYVSDWSGEQTESLSSLSEDFGEQGVALGTRVLAAAVVPAPERIAQRLAMPGTAPVFRLRRLREVDGRPAALVENWVPVDRAPGVADADFAAERLFRVLEDRCGLLLATGVRRFRAVLADREVAGLLGRPPGGPLQHIEQLTRLPDGTPIEFSDIWIDTDTITITTRLSRQRRGNR